MTVVDDKPYFMYTYVMESMKEHLVRRHINLKLHRPVVDEEVKVATFYLYNLSGQLVGYQQYRPSAEKRPNNDPKNGRYFTYRKQPTLAVFGVESLHLTPNVVFLTEGIFDAARLTKLGASTLAALTNNPTPDLRNFLTMLNRKVVAVCDNDQAGHRLAEFGHCVEFTTDKDLGDSSEEFVVNLLHRYQ